MELMEKSSTDTKDIIDQLKTNIDTGLSSAEAEKRLQQYGPNEIPEKEATFFQRIIKRLWGPIPWMIEAAAILSAVVKKWEDFIIITILLFVNVVVDFLQESKAMSALKVLKSKLSKKALVKRDRVFKNIDAAYLVPGDIIKLKIGDVVPADTTLVSGKYIQCDQSALTGESLPVDKATGDTVYSNSIVKMGEMEAMVTGTGMNTFFGKSVELVVKAIKTEKTHFQKAVLKIGNYLIGLTLFLAVILIIASLLRGDPFMEVLRFILVLVVASIPVALPAVMSVTLAIGAINLAKKQAIVSHLAAIEELAGVDVLCSDKTGTLTQNKMTVAASLLYNNFTENDLFLYAALASKKENNDPIELPVFEKAGELKLTDKIKTFTQKEFTPFDPVSKKTEALIAGSNENFSVTKGAPQVILKLCSDEPQQTKIANDVNELATKGYRSLGVAVKKGGANTYSFVGLIPLFDPPREDSASTIKSAKEMGLSVKMITGDNQAIAIEIAGSLEIGKNILNTQELKHDSNAIGIIEKADGFSQVLPEDKYFIIDALQKEDHIVGMTGDGVNDAPALKKADAGIAVSGATDAARAAADLVLLSPGLSVIINALTEARHVFARMKNYATFRIAETIRIILFMTFSILFFNFYPVTAAMIIILALLNDIPIMMIAYDNVQASKTPVRWNMRETLTLSSVLGIAGVIASFFAFYFLKKWGLPEPIIQTMIFLKLAVAGHSTIYVTRTGEKHFWKKPYPSPKLLIPTFTTQIIATFFAVYGLSMQPIGWKYAAYMWAYATIWFVFNDFLKVATYKLIHKKSTS